VDNLNLDTRLAHAGEDEADSARALIPPIHLSVPFRRIDAETMGEFAYSRRGNPTRAALERALEDVEGGGHAITFGSGMAAVTAVGQLLKAGDRVILPREVYGNTHRLYTTILPAVHVEAEFVELGDLKALERALERPAALVWTESPTNPSLAVVDLRSIAELAHERGALMAVDNSLASPYFQRPLELGADLVVESTTKYLNGHDDLMGGAVLAREAAVAERLVYLQFVGGAVPSPFDCWLLLRGMKTMALRMERHQQNAFQVARFLAEHRAVASVSYPGLKDHPQHELAREQMTGYGGMVSFEAHDARLARRVTERTRLFNLAGGLGGVGSLIEYPATMSHASQVVTPQAVSDRLVRLSVGIEHGDDLVADLDRALRNSAADS
jgi:cystathionine gamma-synthase